MTLPASWLPLISAVAALLITASALERPIKRVLRSRWPAFDYDGQLMLAWGVATLGAGTMLVFLLLALLQP